MESSDGRWLGGLTISQSYVCVLIILQIHNPLQTRQLMSQLFDPQMCNVADFDCFSQVVFEDIESYKSMKTDPWYQKHLIGDHEKFADTKRSM